MFDLKRQWADVKGNVKWDITKWSGALMIGAVTYLLNQIGQIPGWVLALAIFLLALVVFWWASKPLKAQAAQATTPLSLVPQQHPPTETEYQKRIEDLYKTGINTPMIAESEVTIEKEANQYAPGEREKYLLRLSAFLLVQRWIESIWNSIYGSQVQLLEELNKKNLSVDDARAIYLKASEQYPYIYAVYPFNSWLEYLSSQQLIKQNGMTLSITIYSKDLLKHMVDTGKSASDRAF